MVWPQTEPWQGPCSPQNPEVAREWERPEKPSCYQAPGTVLGALQTGKLRHRDPSKVIQQVYLTLGPGLSTALPCLSCLLGTAPSQALQVKGHSRGNRLREGQGRVRGPVTEGGEVPGQVRRRTPGTGGPEVPGHCPQKPRG